MVRSSHHVTTSMFSRWVEVVVSRKNGERMRAFELQEHEELTGGKASLFRANITGSFHRRLDTRLNLEF